MRRRRAVGAADSAATQHAPRSPSNCARAAPRRSIPAATCAASSPDGAHTMPSELAGSSRGVS